VGTHAHAQAGGQLKEVQHTIIKAFDSLSDLDLTEVQKYTTKDFILLEDGAVWSMDTLALKIEPLKKTKFNRVNHVECITTEIIGNAAWLVYHNAADYTVNGQKMNRQWMESAFLITEDGGWKIKLLHSTVIHETGH